MDLVLDVGKERVEGAFFEKDQITYAFAIPPEKEALKKAIEGRSFDRIYASLKEPVLEMLGSYETIGDLSPVVYGALTHFPQYNCVVVDLEETVVFTFVSCDGKEIETITYPGINPGVELNMYWGLLGAVERIAFELRSKAAAPSNVRVIATGSRLDSIEDLKKDLSDVVDLIDPMLRLVGIHEIMKEKKTNV